MKVTKNDLGKVVLVKFDDVGRVDGLLVDIEPEHRRANVFFPYDNQLDDIDIDQIVSIGKRVQIGV